MNGDAGIAMLEAEIDASFGDIWDNLTFGFMLAGEVRYKQFGLKVDWLAMHLSIEGTRPVSELPITFDPKLTYLETSFLYSFFHNEKWSADAYAGVRTWWVNAKLETDAIVGEEAREAETKKSWVDPIIGAKVIFLPHKKWPVNAGFDFGGFGAGSDFTWNVQVHLKLRMITTNRQLVVGSNLLKPGQHFYNIGRWD